MNILKKAISLILSIAIVFSIGESNVFAATASELDKLAQEHFDRKEFSYAIALWLSALDLEPKNERIQQKIEMLFDVKQRKDFALQRAKYNYRIAKDVLDQDFELARRRAQLAIDDYIVAYRIDPQDSEILFLRDNMTALNEAVSVEAERRRLSAERREKALQLTAEAEIEMKAERYDTALKLWDEVLKLTPQDVDAQENKRKCQLAIANRIRFETIKNLLAEGKVLYDRKEYQTARLNYQQVLSLDARNKEARTYVRNIDDELERIRSYEQRLAQAEAFYQSGTSSLARNEFDSAAGDFESAIALIDNYKDSRALLRDIPRRKTEHEARERQRRLQLIQQEFQNGLIAFSQSNFRDAIIAFDKTLALDPGNAHAKEYLNRAREAEKEKGEEVVDKFSPYYNIVNSLIVSGKALYDKGMYDESRKKFNQILTLFPNNAIAAEYLFKCEIRMNPEDYARLMNQLTSEVRAEIAAQNFRAAQRRLDLIRSIDPRHPELNTFANQ